MPFNRPTLPELKERNNADLAARTVGSSAVLRRSVLGVLAAMHAGGMHGQYGYLQWISRQILPDTSDDDVLQRQARIYKISKNPASDAVGQVTLTGTNGSVLPAGSVLQRSDGWQYTTDADAIIASGTASVAVTARAEGAAGNTDAGVSLQMVVPAAGIQSSAVVAAGGLTNGTDEETTEQLRAKLLDRIRRPPQGGAARDYEQWAKQVPGVTRAWVYPLHMGPGTVGVTFVRDNDADIIPDAAAVAEVAAYIETVRPVTAEVFVFAPVEYVVDFTLSVEPDTAAVRAAVAAELQDLFDRLGAPGTIIPLTKVNEAISIAEGEENHTVTAPSADIEPGTGAIPVLGTITWL